MKKVVALDLSAREFIRCGISIYFCSSRAPSLSSSARCRAKPSSRASICIAGSNLCFRLHLAIQSRTLRIVSNRQDAMLGLQRVRRCRRDATEGRRCIKEVRGVHLQKRRPGLNHSLTIPLHGYKPVPKLASVQDREPRRDHTVAAGCVR